MSLRRRHDRALLAGLLAALWACFGPPPDWRVTQVTDHGPFRGATLDNGREALRFYFRPEGTCLKMIRSENIVRYVELGRLGRVEAGGEVCEPVGVGALRAWTARRPRPEVLTTLPRAEARFRVVNRDADVVLVRGRFPLARLIQWPSAEDTMAFLPNDASCARFVEQGVGTMQFAARSREVLWMGTRRDGGRCPFLGFAIPPAP